MGYAVTSYHRAEGRPVIGFDMGGEWREWRGSMACAEQGEGGREGGSPDPLAGTSTDVSRYAGEYEHVFEATTAGISIQVPQLDINTVAAGGGSRLFFR